MDSFLTPGDGDDGDDAERVGNKKDNNLCCYIKLFFSAGELFSLSSLVFRVFFVAILIVP